MSVKLIYVTAPSHHVAEEIARTVVTEHLAACANILDGVTSLFHWEGRLCREQEALLLLKTADERAGQLVERIRQLHPYQCPGITVLPIEHGNPAFLQWINEATGTP